MPDTSDTSDDIAAAPPGPLRRATPRGGRTAICSENGSVFLAG
jgi:hypothetical protein